jgi:O-antigen/teichoic acid export membrane protein
VSHPSPDFNRAWLNSAATVVVKGALAAVRILFLLWAARLIGPEAFGRLALCFAIVEVLRTVVDFGTESLFLRSLARTAARTDQIDQLARFRLFRFVATSIGVLLYWGAVEAVLNAPVTRLDLMPGALIISSAGIGYALTYYQSKLGMRRAALLLLPVGLVAVAILAVLHPQQIESQLALLIAFETAVLLVFMIDMAREGLFQSSTPRQGSYLRTTWDVLFASLPLAAVGLLATAYTRLDVMIIAPVVGSVGLGLYSFAYRISEPLRFVASAVDSTLYSYLSARIEDVDKGELRRLLVVVFIYASVLAISAVLLGWVLVYVAYQEYHNALPTLGLLGIALFLRCVNGFLTALLYAKGLFRTVLKIATYNAMLMTVIIYPFVAGFGIIGAAASLLAVEMLNCVLQSRATSAGTGPPDRGSLSQAGA